MGRIVKNYTKVVNLTPHAVNILGAIFPPSGTVARVEVEQEYLHNIMMAGIEVPVYSNTYGAIEHLPEPQEGTLYIVSGLVKAATSREDVVAPDTGKSAVRNDKGHIQSVVRVVG